MNLRAWLHAHSLKLLAIRDAPEAIAGGVERNARTVLTPRIGWIFVAFSRLFPGIVESRLAAINRPRVSP